MSKRGMALFLCLSLSACDDKPRKTESMLRLENAQQQVQDYVTRANSVLDRAAGNELSESLSDLVYVKELQSNAKAVFPNKQIRDLAQPELDALTARIAALNPQLSQQAIALMEKLIEKTLVLQAKVFDLNSRPLSGSVSGAKSMVDFLADEYKKDIQACCLEDLSRISIILHDSPVPADKQLSRLLGKIDAELTGILTDPVYADTLRQQLNTLYAAE